MDIKNNKLTIILIGIIIVLLIFLIILLFKISGIESSEGSVIVQLG